MAELKTFLFTDICGSVRLKNEMPGRSVSERDLAFINTVLTPHRQKIEAGLAEHSGRVVSTAGDGHFLVFDHTVQAAQWAASMQESHRDEPIVAPDGKPVEVRVSIHSGVPQIDPGDPCNFIGKSVDYASRLNDYATGGQILISRSVMAILDDVSLEGIRLHLHGRRNLKGIGNVEVHEMLYDASGPRPLRNQPKNVNTERQWTVVPTMGFEEGAALGGGGAAATTTALRRVGNYELEELLGSGGMGDVYKARHTQFSRVRAVKVIKPQFVSAGHGEIIRRFYNEIKAVGRLEHRNIVVAIDSSAPTDNIHYLVMEYIEGVSVDELVAGHGPLPIAEACEIIRQAARGLQYIHKNDMVHRDIKPSNLMITLVDGDAGATSDSTVTHNADGKRAVVKILDLGLALLATDAQDRLTRYDQKAMGTGMYMPPEQWKSTSVDIRADIYSLGCTLYHLLAGNPPFYDSDLRPEKAHEKSVVPQIRSGIQPLPKKLWEVLRTMLEKRPDDRFSTPAEVAAALEPFTEGHNLAAVVSGHESGEIHDSALRETKPDGSSRVDTRRSRPWFSGVELRPSRRWLLGTALPLALIAVFGAGAMFILNKTNQESLRQHKEEARQNMVNIATHAAKTTLPQELKKRFEVLNAAAQSPELVEALEKLNVEVPADGSEVLDKDALKAIDTWIASLAHQHGDEIVLDSWFVCNKYGVQVARSPLDDKSMGKSYRYRDYFHGLAKDIAPNDPDLKNIEPIKRNNLSLVYRSSTSGLLKVAFSVPIWSRPPGETNTGDPAQERVAGELRADSAESAAPKDPEKKPEVIGVLGMSVNVHEFKVLEDELAGGNDEVVLVDLRPSWIDGAEKRGLILHHPRLSKGKLRYLDTDLLKRIDAAEPLTKVDFDSKDSILDDKGYADPLALDSDQRFWGAFEPVHYEVGDVPAGAGPTDRIGWVVLVQRKVIE